MKPPILVVGRKEIVLGRGAIGRALIILGSLWMLGSFWHDIRPHPPFVRAIPRSVGALTVVVEGVLLGPPDKVAQAQVQFNCPTIPWNIPCNVQDLGMRADGSFSKQLHLPDVSADALQQSHTAYPLYVSMTVGLPGGPTQEDRQLITDGQRLCRFRPIRLDSPSPIASPIPGSRVVVVPTDDNPRDPRRRTFRPFRPQKP